MSQQQPPKVSTPKRSNRNSVLFLPSPQSATSNSTTISNSNRATSANASVSTTSTGGSTSTTTRIGITPIESTGERSAGRGNLNESGGGRGTTVVIKYNAKDHSARLESEYFSRRTRPPYFNNGNDDDATVLFNNLSGGSGSGSGGTGSPSFQRSNSLEPPNTSLSSLSSPFLRRHKSIAGRMGGGGGGGSSGISDGDGTKNAMGINSNHLNLLDNNSGHGGGSATSAVMKRVTSILSVSSLVSAATSSTPAGGTGNANANAGGNATVGGYPNSVSTTSPGNLDRSNHRLQSSATSRRRSSTASSTSGGVGISSSPYSYHHHDNTVTTIPGTGYGVAGILHHHHNNNNNTIRPKTTFINCPSRIHSSLDYIFNNNINNTVSGNMHQQSGNSNIISNVSAGGGITTGTPTGLNSSSIHSTATLPTSNHLNMNTSLHSLGGKNLLHTPSKGMASGGIDTADNRDNTMMNNSNNNSNNNVHQSNRKSNNNNHYYNNNNIMINNTPVTPTWRLKERMKTVGVGLILALNIPTPPPDVHRPDPCAKLICWIDPTTGSRAKAREKIGELLENQYAKWQGQQRAKLKYRRALDPTVEDVRNLCFSMRRAAKSERLLLHYNGLGVPRPTSNGEIWVFDKHHRQYIPLPITDLKKWAGKPSLIVLDCSGAGALLPFLINSNHGGGGMDGMIGQNQDGSQFLSPAGVGSNGHGGMNVYGKSMNIPFNQTYGQNVPQQNRTCVEEDEEAAYAAEAVRDFIVLCPTSASETLPMNPELPADLFTSCLTTPIPIALRWFVHQNPLSSSIINPNDVDLIPGKLSDRKTPLGELNWIFTAITDNIAWNVLPSALFQRLFRQDLLVASMFRNFLLADRILRALNCTPMSHPALPSTCDHPLWQAWDLAVETCLSQLMREGVLGANRPLARAVEKEQNEAEHKKNGGHKGVLRATSDGTLGKHIGSSGSGVFLSRSQPSSKLTSSYNITAPFFAEQLTAFEIWLDFAANRIKEGGVILNPPRKQHEGNSGAFDIESPEQLPVVLQVLLSPAHRVRALILLRRFLNLGPSAVNLALSVGIFPYVLRLLQSQIDEYKHVLVGIWNKILEFDPSCQVDLVKDAALPHFINHLHWRTRQIQDGNQGRSNNPNNKSQKVDSGYQRTMAAVILAAICSGYSNGQAQCMNHNLHGTCCEILLSTESKESNTDVQNKVEPKLAVEADKVPSQLRMWLCICLGVMFKETGREKAFRADVHLRLFSKTSDDSPEVRAAACYAIGSLVGPSDRRMVKKDENVSVEQKQPKTISQMFSPSPLAYNTGGVQQQGLSPLGNLLMQKQQFIPAQSQGQGQLQPMQQYSNMSSYNPSDSAGLVFSPKQAESQTILQSMTPPLTRANFPPPSVFEDDVSLGRDLLIMEKMIDLCDDACPNVRYEATVVLGKAVDRYLMAFVAVANNTAGTKEKDQRHESAISMPEGVDKETENLFMRTWKLMRYLHDNEPHPAVSNAATAILRFVNEHILVLETNFRRVQERRSYSERQLDVLGMTTNKNDLSPQRQYLRTNSAINLGEHSMSVAPRSKSLRLSSLHEINECDDSERSMSPIGPLPTKEDVFSSDKSEAMDGHVKIDLMNILPSSKFYEWKKKVFEEEENNDFSSPPDPLSSDGAVRLYREQRNLKMDTNCATFSDSFAILQPKRRKRYNTFDGLTSFDIHGDLPDLDDDSNDQEFEAEVASKKEALHLQEKSLLSNIEGKGTYMLRFHAYESVLASSDGSDCVTIWDTDRSVPTNYIMNCNPPGTRMTSMSWINERNNTLLLTGCEDGSVRVFDNAIKDRASMGEDTTLSTAFYAMPELEPNKRGSGLVTEWQQYNGRLLTGGNTNIIRCWDLQSEKCRTKIETDNVSACLTAFETAWDYVQNHGGDEGYSGIGPDIVLGGYSDGIIKVFDLRAHNQQETTIPTRRKFFRHRKEQELSEHSHWIVNVCFMHCGSNNEVASGSILGDVKFWDMRNLRSSVDTQEVQRTPMTAFVSHPRIPLLATGSHANFIKLFTPDGDVFQVIRNHQGQANRKIGPVSVLTFHPNKPMLAAGATDEIIGIYNVSKPKHEN